jgi:hypothetical protein
LPRVSCSVYRGRGRVGERVDACRERGHDIKMIPLYEGLVHFGLKIPFVLSKRIHTIYLAWKAGRVRR